MSDSNCSDKCCERINHIKCGVVNCSYHSEGDCCHADMIEVGPSFAVNDSDTQCSTFKAK